MNNKIIKQINIKLIVKSEIVSLRYSKMMTFYWINKQQNKNIAECFSAAILRFYLPFLKCSQY